MFNRKSLKPILLPAFFAVILAVSAYTEPQAATAQTAPDPVGTQPAPAAPVKAETQLVVECVAGENHECATDVSVPLGHHIKLKVRNLKNWIDQKNSPSNLVLFLNGRQLAKTYPVAIEIAYDPAHPERTSCSLSCKGPLRRTRPGMTLSCRRETCAAFS